MTSGIMLVRYTFAIKISSNLKVPIISGVKLILKSKYIQITMQMQQWSSCSHPQTVIELPRIPISSHEHYPPIKHGLKSINQSFFKKILRDLIMCMPCLDMYMCMQVLKSWEDCVWAPRIVVTSINELPYVSGGNLTWFLCHMSTLTTEQSLQAPI